MKKSMIILKKHHLTLNRVKVVPKKVLGVSNRNKAFKIVQDQQDECQSYITMNK